MYNKFLSVLLILMISISATAAKNNGIITGKVSEKGNGSPLSFATISIQDKENKILGGATSGDDGKFLIDKVIYGECKIKVSFIGFRDTTFTVNINQSSNTVDLGEIKLASNSVTLSSAIVTAKVPVIEQKLDKIIFNVSEAVSTQGSNALDILRKAPGVSIDPDGNILLNGSAVQIWIDGRPSNMTGQQLDMLLSGTDAATIDKIEILAHPSAKYDASGSGGIINIRTKKNFVKGINGFVKAGYSASPYYSKNYDGVDGTLNLNYRGEKTNTSLSYSPRFGERFNDFYSTTDMGGGLILDGSTKSDVAQRYHNLRLSSDFFINKKNVVGVIISGLERSGEDITDDNITGNTLFRNGQIIEKTATSIDNSDMFRTWSGNINYTHTIKDGQEFTLNADYGRYKTGQYSFQENLFTDNSGLPTREANIFRSNSDQVIEIISAKADYEQIMFKNYKLEAGAKFARSLTDNNLLREDKIDGIWSPNQNLSSIFGYTENISAAYVSVARQFGPKWSLKAGLRGEMTDATGNWTSADTTTHKTYTDLFPTLFVGYTPNKDFRFGLSYTKRVNRPRFFQLNPFRIYVDANSAVEGNPELMPQYSHMMGLTLGYKQHYSINLVGQINEGVIIQNPYFNPETGEKLLIWQNFGTQAFFGGSFSISELPLTKWFVLNANANLLTVTNTTENFNSGSLYANGYLNATFLLPKDYKVELTGSIQSGIPYGYFKIKPSGDVNIGVKKSLFANKGTVALNISDIFNTRSNRAELNTDVVNGYNFHSNYNSRQITISFQYRFGQSKAVKTRKVGNNEEASRTGAGN